MKNIWLVLLLTTVACGQNGGPNSVAQVVASASVLATQQTVAISSFNAVGQSSHQLYVFTAEGPNGCAANNYDWGHATLQGSTDNTFWINIQSLRTDNSNTNSTPIVSFGSGVYPYLRVIYKLTSNGGNANCATTIWYTASISPRAYTASIPSINDKYIWTPFTFSTSGAHTVGASCDGITAGNTYVLYELYIFNPGGINTLTIRPGGTNTDNANNAFLLTTFQQYAQFTAMPFTGKAYFVSKAAATTSNGQTLQIDSSAATEVDGFVMYRCE